jgi:hypothetical protein
MLPSLPLLAAISMSKLFFTLIIWLIHHRLAPGGTNPPATIAAGTIDTAGIGGTMGLVDSAVPLATG